MIEEKTKSCLIYCRVSYQDQLKGMSLEVQKNACIKWAKDNKYTVAGIYKDEAKTGTKTAGREGLEDTLIHCEKEKIDDILVFDTDRFARNEEDHFAIKAYLKKYGTKIIAINQPMIDDSAEGMLMETVLIGINAFYSRLTGRKVKKSLENKWNEGWWPGWAPLGYKNVNIGTEDHPVRVVKIDEKKGPLVRKAFKLYASGNYSLVELIKILDRKDLKTRNGKPLAHSTMQQILSNTFYYGFMKWNGKEKWGMHEPLIDKKLFDICRLMANKNGNYAIRDRKYKFLLKGLLICGECKEHLTAQWRFNLNSKKNKNIAYYRCQKRKPCKQAYIEMKDMEKQVYEQLKQVRFTKSFTDALTRKVKKYLKSKDKDVVYVRRRLLNKRNSVISKRDVLEERMLSKMVDGLTYKRIHDELQSSLLNINEELTKLDVVRKFDFDLLEEVLEITRNIPKTYKNAPPFLKKKYLHFFFDHIVVNDKNIENTVFSPLLQELINQKEVILRTNWLPR